MVSMLKLRYRCIIFSNRIAAENNKEAKICVSKTAKLQFLPAKLCINYS